MDHFPKWYIDLIEQFQKLDFFGGQSISSTSIAQQVVDASSKDVYFGNVLDLENKELRDQVILSYDTKSVWRIQDYLVLGAEPEFKGNFYPQVFKRLEAISNGMFQTKNIRFKDCKQCDGGYPRLVVQFNFQGGLAEVIICQDLDVLSLDFLEEINEFILPLSYSFEVFSDSYGHCFVFFVSKLQKEGLQNQFSWEFERSPGYWSDRAKFAIETNKTNEANSCFKKAIKLSTLPHYVSDYVLFLEEHSKYKEAIPFLETAIKNIENSESNPRTDWWLKGFKNDLKRFKKHV